MCFFNKGWQGMSRALILVMRLPKGNNDEEDGNYNTKEL
jgi:hypothetical protein